MKDFDCVFVRTEMNLIAFSGPRNCVNTQYAVLSGAMVIKLLLLPNTQMLYLLCKNGKMPTIVGILTLMSMINFMLSVVEHENVLLLVLDLKFNINKMILI